MAIMTFAEAKAQIARSLGNESDSVLLTEAGDELTRCMEELSLKDLEWLLTSEDISLVAGTSEYTFTAGNMRKVYSVRLQTTKRPLMYIEQRLWDRIATDQTSNRTPFAYTIFRSSNTVSKIRIIPPPSQAETMRVRYYRLITAPSGSNALDIVERYQAWVVYQAKANVLANHGENESRIAFWQSRADAMLAEMTAEDQHNPDRDEYFMPGSATSFIYPPDHPAAVLMQLDGY